MSLQLYANVEDRRDKLQIYYDIIKVTIRPTKITKILRLANIQYNTFHDCIDKLLRAGLLEKVNAIRSSRKSSDKRIKCSYKATKLGLEWCDEVDYIYKILEDT
jgi:predicted transcriptional regulator